MLCVLYWCWKIFLFFADIYKGGNEGCYLPAVREVIHVKKINSVKSTFWSLNIKQNDFYYRCDFYEDIIGLQKEDYISKCIRFSLNSQ